MRADQMKSGKEVARGPFCSVLRYLVMLDGIEVSLDQIALGVDAKSQADLAG